GTFALVQFACSNFLSYGLTDVLSSLASLASTMLFLRLWQPVADASFAVRPVTATPREAATPSMGRAGAPWFIVSATVIAWTTLAVAKLGETKIAWPGLHDKVSITLYNGAPYSAIWHCQPLGTGTAILVATIVTARILKVGPATLLECATQT